LKFVLWRRPICGEGKLWEKIPGVHETRTAALEAVSQAELTAGTGEWSYSIMPEGQTPAVYPQTYRHRMMRSHP